MMYILGIITGLLVAIIVFVVALWSKPKVERIVNQVSSRLSSKGEIFEPSEIKEELDSWVENLKHE